MSFLAPITQHIFHIRVLTLVVLCGPKKQQKKQSFAIAIAHFQFSSQTRVDGYSCQHVSAVCTHLWTFYTLAKMSWSWKINSGVPKVFVQASADGWNGKENFFSFFVLPRMRNTAFCAEGFRRSFTFQMTGADTWPCRITITVKPAPAFFFLSSAPFSLLIHISLSVQFK